MIKKENPILRILFGVFSIALITWGAFSNPTIKGDGHEYSVILEAIYNHGTPDIRASDLEQILDNLERFKITPWAEVFRKMYDAVKSGTAVHGIYPSHSGSYYGYHFFAYSASAVPAKFLLSIVGGNEALAFQLTNIFLLVFCVYFLLYKTSPNWKQRIFIGVSFVLTGTMYYIDWTHPELFSGVFVLLASVLFLEKRFSLSALFSVIASWQNPSAAALALFAIPASFYEYHRANGTSLCREFFIKNASLGFIVSLASVPYLFYYLNYGTTSMIVRSGAINTNLISFSRAISFLFDLNQGWVVAAPGILVGWILVFPYLMRRVMVICREHHLSDGLSVRHGLLLLGSLLMLVPTLSQVNWNSGQTVEARYAYWTTIPLLVLLAHILEQMKIENKAEVRAFARVTSDAVIVIQVIVSAFYMTYSDNETRLKPFVKKLWQHYPSLYDPEPQIFIDRIHGRKNNGPVAFKDSEGFIRKVLIFKASRPSFEEILCGAGGRLIGDDGALVEVNKIQFKKHPTFQDYGYLSGRFRCGITLPFAQKFDLNSMQNSSFLLKNWYPSESIGTWTLGANPSLSFILTQAPSKPVVLSTTFFTLTPNQNISVFANDQLLGRWSVEKPFAQVDMSATIPVDAFKGSALKIAFGIDKPSSPAELGISSDARRLGMFVSKVRLE